MTGDDWCTPKVVADLIGPVRLDPCSNARSHVHADHRVMLPDDGLALSWCSDTIFVNPPYSRPLPWCEAAVHAASVMDSAVMLLVKLDPTTKWWRVLSTGPNARFFLFRKRLRFEQPGQALVANFPSALITLGHGFGDATTRLTDAGWLW